MGAAQTVRLGILASRLVGLIRERVLAHVAGASAASDVFVAALRGPNLVQNLLGEQALSAAFVPIYSRLLERGNELEARRFARAIGGLLLVASALLGLLGVVLAPWLVTALYPGWRVRPELFGPAVDAVRVVFPMTALLVMSAWCLAILNSHRRFFLPYFAPVLWNLATIVGLLVGARLMVGRELEIRTLVLAGCTGALVGGILQLAIQLPSTARAAGGLRLTLELGAPGVREALRAFGPVLASRGVVQLSGYLDQVLISFLVVGAFASIGYAQRIYLMAVSLFGSAVAAAELPELSRLDGTASADSFQRRFTAALRSMSLLAIPTQIGFLIFGFPMVGALLRTGRFDAEANWLVYWILAAYGLGLTPTTASRLSQNAFYALGDTATPSKIAALRMAVSVGLGTVLMLTFERWQVGDLVTVEGGAGLRTGAVGLALASAAAGWLEWWMLRRSLHRRELCFGVRPAELLALVGLALAAALPAAGLWAALRWGHPLWIAPLIVAVYAAFYLVLARAAGVEEARTLLQSVVERLRRRR